MSNSAKANGLMTGEIFAVINDGKYTNTMCTTSTWSNNDFCPSDMAAIAAAQIKTQTFLTFVLNNQAMDPLLPPAILRISSYDKQSPSHLVPDTDSGSLSSMIDWLVTMPALGLPPETLFKLHDATGDKYYFQTTLMDIETEIESGLQAEYPDGDISQQQTISMTVNGDVVLAELKRYSCFGGVTDFLALKGMPTPQGGNCSELSSLGYAEPYPDPVTPCFLFDPLSHKPVPYSPACPNAANVPVWQYERPYGSAAKQYYYTINQKDTNLTVGGWAPSQTNPVFMVPPNFPLYQQYEPIGFQGGLITNWGPGGKYTPPVLTLFNGKSMQPMHFGWQPDPSDTSVSVLALDGPLGFDRLICGNPPGGSDNCPFLQGTSIPCVALQKPPRPSLSCSSQQNAGLTQFDWGSPPPPQNSESCCAANPNNPDAPGQDPVTNIFPQDPYLRIYSNDNSCIAPSGTSCGSSD